MDAGDQSILYSVEPNSERFFRWLRQLTATAIRVYWELFVSIPVTIFAMFFALVALFACVIEIAHHPSRFLPDLLPMAGSVAFLVFRRVRAFVWTLLGCFILWVVLVASLLLPIMGRDYLPLAATAKVLLGTLYFLPPFLAAIYIDYAMHRKA